MPYFTIFHIIALVVIFILFIIFLLISLKEERIKVLIFMVVANLFVMSSLTICAMLILDKYTKQAKVLDLRYERVLITESMVIMGSVRNIGKFNILACSINIKLANAPITRDKLSGSIFKQKGFFDIFRADINPSVVEKKIRLVSNLHAGETKQFSIYMPYPTYFRTPSLYYTISCY